MTVKKSTRGRAGKRGAQRALEPNASAETVTVSLKRADMADSAEPLPLSKRPRKGRAASELDESAFASLEIQLRKTVAELGLDSARKIFASVEAAFAR